MFAFEYTEIRCLKGKCIIVKTTHIIHRFRINLPHFGDNHVHYNLTKYFEYGHTNIYNQSLHVGG